MNMIRHFVAGLVFFAIGITFYISIYNGISSSYGFTDTSGKAIVEGGESLSMIEHLNQLNIVSGINKTTSAIMLIKPSTTESISLDKLFEAAMGVFTFIFGLLSFPFEIVSIISQFYLLPAALISLISVLTIVYFIFIYFSKNLRGEI